MEAKTIKQIIFGQVVSQKWGTSIVLADQHNHEFAHINPYGAHNSGEPSEEHTDVSELLKTALNNTYQIGIDPAKLPKLFENLQHFEQELKMVEIKRGVQNSVQRQLFSLRKELARILDEVKIEQ